MDQNSFRQLLATPRTESSSTPVGKSNQKATLDSAQPAFHPRKVKKRAKQSDYRDRASERRAGINEYAEVESVLEDFEQRTAGVEDREAVEQQRRYLGGDKDHTILVKGLDLALLEQNRARVAASYEDDDSLEAVFQEAQITSTVPSKRTREDLIRELKEKRTTHGKGGGPSPQIPLEADDALEKAKKVGKFKPIGVPENLNKTEATKNGKGKKKVGESERKKKRKVMHGPAAANRKRLGESDRAQRPMLPPLEPSTRALSTTDGIPAQPGSSHTDPPHTPEESADVDIFADVEEYEGVDFGEEDDDDGGYGVTAPPLAEDSAPDSSQPNETAAIKNWFMEEKESTTEPGPSSARSPTPSLVPEAKEEFESAQSTRLAPLASSALPSISDFLAMDAQADATKKRSSKKVKKQGERKGKVGTEVKVDRDYRKLSSYMAKKGGGNAET